MIFIFPGENVVKSKGNLGESSDSLLHKSACVWDFSFLFRLFTLPFTKLLEYFQNKFDCENKQSILRNRVRCAIFHRLEIIDSWN